MTMLLAPTSDWLLSSPISDDGQFLYAGSTQLVGYWERDIQFLLADHVASLNANILEIGYGLGLCSQRLKTYKLKAHTIIEAHPLIASTARKRNPRATVIVDYFENITNSLPLHSFDGIIYDAYPSDYIQYDGTLAASLSYLIPSLDVAFRLLTPFGTLAAIDFSCLIPASLEWKLHLSRTELICSYKTIKCSVPPNCHYTSRSEAVILFLRHRSVAPES